MQGKARAIRVSGALVVLVAMVVIVVGGAGLLACTKDRPEGPKPARAVASRAHTAPSSNSRDPALAAGPAENMSALADDQSSADTPQASCHWTNWGCGVQTCPSGFHVAGVSFNRDQSEGCWGHGNDLDEPFRKLRCCDAPFASHTGCYWSGWGCGSMQCPSGHFLAAVDFNATQSEGCWGHGNDFDEPFRRVRCCQGDVEHRGCFWTGWGCGAQQCPAGHYQTGVDFNAAQGEECWGHGNKYDEPFRRIRCCRE